jgi:hypothetical protein
MLNGGGRGFISGRSFVKKSPKNERSPHAATRGLAPQLIVNDKLFGLNP